MTRTESNQIHWIVVCVNEFAKYKGLEVHDAFMYLYQFGGISFLVEHYDAEHTLSFNEAVEDLDVICTNKGGSL